MLYRSSYLTRSRMNSLRVRQVNKSDLIRDLVTESRSFNRPLMNPVSVPSKSSAESPESHPMQGALTTNNKQQVSLRLQILENIEITNSCDCVCRRSCGTIAAVTEEDRRFQGPDSGSDSLCGPCGHSEEMGR